MNTLKNIAWLLCGGFLSVAFWGMLGGLFYITVIGKTLGKQLLLVARFAAWPFRDDVEVESNFGKHPVANLIWLLTFGIPTIIVYIFCGVVFAVTLIGYPIAKMYFRLLCIAMAPFGIEVDEKVEVIKEWEEWKNW